MPCRPFAGSFRRCSGWRRAKRIRSRAAGNSRRDPGAVTMKIYGEIVVTDERGGSGELLRRKEAHGLAFAEAHDRKVIGDHRHLIVEPRDHRAAGESEMEIELREEIQTLWREADLFHELAAKRFFRRFAGIDAAAEQAPMTRVPNLRQIITVLK